MKRRRSMWRNSRGASAVEFALIAPAFILLIIGIAEMGMVFFANAGLKNALAEGARRATLFPRPSPAVVRERIDAARWGLDPAKLTIDPIVYDDTASPPFATISMRYTVPFNLIFIKLPDITLRQTRRVYLQPAPTSGRIT